jgi:hypothetical protein
MGKNHDLERIAPSGETAETIYQKGVKMCKKVFEAMSNRMDRDASLPKYYVTIQPQT